MINSIKKKLELDLEDVIFDPELHKYFYKNENFISVTQFISKYKNKFDANKISCKMSGGDPVKQNEILNEWKLASDKSINIGNYLHYNMDLFICEILKKEAKQIVLQEMSEEDLNNAKKMYQKCRQIVEIFFASGYKIFNSEQLVFNARNKICGQIDLILYRENCNAIEFLILDYKTNKKKSFEVNSYTDKMLPPFDYLDDYSVNTYKIQLSIYKYIFGEMLKKTGVKFFINTAIIAINADNPLIIIDKGYCDKIINKLNF